MALGWALTVALVVVVVFVLAVVIKYVGKVNGLPGPGHGAGRRLFREHKEDVWVEFAHRHGKTFDYEGMVATCDPSVVHAILTKRQHVQSRSMLYRLFSGMVPGAGSLLFTQQEAWTRHSAVVAPVLAAMATPPALAKLHRLTDECVNTWLERGAEAAAGSGQTAPTVANSGVGGDGGDGGAGGGDGAAAREVVVPDLFGAMRHMHQRHFLEWGCGFQRGPRVEALGRHMTKWRRATFEQMLESSSKVMMAVYYVRVVAEARRMRRALCTVLDTAAGASAGSGTEPGSGSGSASGSSSSSGAGSGRRGGRARRRESPQGSSDGRDTFVSRMLGAGWARSKIADELNHIHGLHAASAFIATCALFELSRVPQRRRWLEALRAEGQAAFRKSGRQHPSAGDLPRLPLTMAVMKETLRLHAVTMGVVRRLGEPLPVTTGAGQQSRKEVLPPGTEVLVLLHALHTHPDHFRSASTFDPTRWVKSTSQHGRRSRQSGIGGPQRGGSRRRGGRGGGSGDTGGGSATHAGHTEASADSGADASGTGSGSGGGGGSGGSGGGGHSSDAGGGTAPPTGVAHSFLPFLGGTRRCGGEALAEIQFAVVLHCLLVRVDVTVLPTVDRIPLRDSMFASVAGPIPCRVTSLS